MNPNSILIDQSQLSLLGMPQRNETQIKCEQLLRQASQYRTLIRELKQENQWLRVQNEGLQSEHSVMKEIMQEKKDLIVNINQELRRANHEIGRLEEELEQEKISTEHLGSLLSEKQKQAAQFLTTADSLRCELIEANLKLYGLRKSQQIQSSDRQQLNTKQFQDRIVAVIEKYSRTEPQIQRTGSLQIWLQGFIRKAEDNATKSAQLVQQLERKLQHAERRIEDGFKGNQALIRHMQQAENQAKQLQAAAEVARSRINVLQKQLQNQSRESLKDLDCATQAYSQRLARVCELLGLILKQEALDLRVLVEPIINSKNQPEVQIAMQQLSNMVSKVVIAQHMSCRSMGGFKEWEKKYNILAEDYDSLRLKNLALQRQYDAVLDDNKRMLKYSQLSKFRVDRMSRSRNKENAPLANWFPPTTK